MSNKSSRVFIAVPRRYPGVPSTLNYIKLEDGQNSYVNPKLHSFPNYEMNELDVSKTVFCFTQTVRHGLRAFGYKYLNKYKNILLN